MWVSIHPSHLTMSKSSSFSFSHRFQFAVPGEVGVPGGSATVVGVPVLLYKVVRKGVGG